MPDHPLCPEQENVAVVCNRSFRLPAAVQEGALGFGLCRTDQVGRPEKPQKALDLVVHLIGDGGGEPLVPTHLPSEPVHLYGQLLFHDIEGDLFWIIILFMAIIMTVIMVFLDNYDCDLFVIY